MICFILWWIFGSVLLLGLIYYHGNDVTVNNAGLCLLFGVVWPVLITMAIAENYGDKVLIRRKR